MGGCVVSVNTPAREPLMADGLAATVAAISLSAALAFAISLQAWWIYAVAHVAVAGLAAAYALCTAKPPRRQAILLAVSAAFLGALGAAGALLSIVMEAVFRPQARGFMSWYDDLFPEEEVEAADLLLNRLRAGGDPAHGAADLVSFTDAVTYGTIEQKQAIVALIARRFSPVFAPALQQALADPVPAVRVQAAAAAASIEAKFAARAMALEKEAALQGFSLSSLKKLGRLNAEFARSGILEHARAAAAREKALDYFRRALAIEPSDAQALTACGELLLEQNDAAAAARYLAEAMAKAGVSQEAAALLMEALMRERRFDELRAFARAGLNRFIGQDDSNKRLRAAMTLWAREAA
jgi:polysaccharide biosynthesis protein PelE